MAGNKNKGNVFALPPSGDDMYFIVKIPKKDIKPGMKIGGVKLLPTDPVLACVCDSLCCDGWSPCAIKD